MRQDQIQSLGKRAEELVDVFLAESDETLWPGHGLQQTEMTKEHRGDRYWSKKNAVATLACAQRIVTLLQAVKDPGKTPAPDGGNLLEAEVEAAEKEAKALMAKVQGAGKATFDKRIHGRQ